MRHLCLLGRFLHIQFVLAKHGLDKILTATSWFSGFRLLVYLNPWSWLHKHTKARGIRIREALEELGPIFIKLGQTLSTRPDLLPEDIIGQLTLLQDKVKPFEHVDRIIREIYGDEFEQIFIEFDNTPLAAASIAQVHRAKLANGQAVVVKILRPNIRKQIERDVALLYRLARLIERYYKPSRWLKPKEFVQEFQRALLHELDLMREAANASQLRRNFALSPDLYIPKVYWPYCRDKAIVFEEIHGIPILEILRLKPPTFNMKRLAERGVKIFFTQVFRDCFFHADMHPGNIFINPENPGDAQYIAVDFGIVGTLNPTDQRYLAENMLAFFKRNYRRVAELHVDSGWVQPDTRIDEFEAAIRSVCEPIFERPLKDISFGQLLLRLLQTGKQFNMQIQPQLLLLQKTLLHIEGLGRQLYPELDLWATAKPFLEEWIKKRSGLKMASKKIWEQIPYIIEKAPEIPELIYQTLQHFSKPRNLPHYNSSEINYHLPMKLQKLGKAHFLLGFGWAFVIGGLINYLIGAYSWKQLNHLAAVNLIVILIGFIILSIGFFRNIRG